MKLLYDFFPIVLFFIAYKLYGVFVATAVAIAASFVQIIITWFMKRQVEKMQVITFLLIAVLGGATLFLHDAIFIKWKPTIINWLFAIVFLGSQFIGKKPIVQRLMDKNIQLPSQIWSHLNYSWVGFFTLLGILNLYVVYNFSTDIWVNFKLFGMLGLTFVFIVIQAFYLHKHIDPDKANSIEKDKAS